MTAPTDAETIAALAAQIDTTPADLLAHAAESVRAPTETPGLTTERARELAARWAEAHGRGVSRPATEFEQLFAWVRARMAADLERDPGLSRVDLATMVEGNLAETIPPGEPHPGLGAAWNLCSAVGWPS